MQKCCIWEGFYLISATNKTFELTKSVKLVFCFGKSKNIFDGKIQVLIEM